jgi:Ca2+-binding RTX toxin-like protein
VVRQGHLVAVVGALLIVCAVLLIVVGCSGTRSEASKQDQGHTKANKHQQAHTEATMKERGRSPYGTESEEARCDGTRTYQREGGVRGDSAVLTTNDLPDCPKGGLLLGTDKSDKLDGKEGDDEIRGLGAADQIFGGVGKDVIYGGPGDDLPLGGRDGDDVIHGGPGDDSEVFD